MSPPINAPIANSFECDACGTIRHSHDAHVPVGWSTCEGSAWCADCTAASVPQRHLSTARSHRRAA